MVTSLLLTLVGVVAIALLISYQLRLTALRRRAEEAEKKAEDARRLKAQFIANVSHELKTPLNTIVGYTDLLREKKYGEMSAEQDDILRRVQSASQRFLALIQNLLDFSGAELGKIDVKISGFDLNGELASTLEIWEKLAEEKGVKITSSLDPEVGEVNSDRQKIHQAVANILSNAVKFTEKGSIELNSKLLNGELVLIEVKDTGIGIAEAHLPYVFEEFRQEDGTIKRDYGGTGLGLSISQKFVHFLGGDIGVKSKKGSGTSVRIVIPKSITHPMRREAERAPARKVLDKLP
ncbi:MAG: HAMP domain-containing histidine kinase [Candidatus Omnitrophica bacterium]|nr:HAMP domain-containing histidine kinase [Candidatus Omnitrophota bacterium]